MRGVTLHDRIAPRSAASRCGPDARSESRADGDGAPVFLGLQPPTASCPKRPSWAPSSERPNAWSDSAKAFFLRRSAQPATRSIFSRDMGKAAARDRTSCETVRSFAAAPRSSSARSQAGRRTCRVSITSDRRCRSVLMRVTVWHQARTRNAPSHAVYRLRTTRPAALSRQGQSGLMKLSCWAQHGCEQAARDALQFTAVRSRS